MGISKNILIVHDNPEEREAIKKQLSAKKWGEEDWVFWEADNAATGYELCKNHKIDCIVINELLPDMNAIEFLAKINRSDQLYPVIMLTGTVEKYLISKLKEFGTIDLLDKKNLNQYDLGKMVANSIEKNNLSIILKKQEQKIKDVIYHDPLTKLPNRLYFQETLERSISYARRHNVHMALLYINLDDFKRVNNIFGTRIGDELLKEVAKRIVRSIRKEDFVARLNGDDFALILTTISEPQYAGIVAKKIIDDIYHISKIKKEDIRINANIGVAYYPGGGLDEDTLKKNAAIALYQAKQKGPNEFQFHSPDLTKIHMKRLMLENELMFALDRNELFLMFQPKFDIKKNEIIGVEALVRWANSKLGTVIPEKFISVAEKLRTIIALDHWVIKNACEIYSDWLKKYHDLGPLAINLSSQLLMDDKFPQFMKKILVATNVPPEKIEIEITEKVLNDDSKVNSRTLKDLKDMGIRLILDDFGIGNSSLKNLKKLPISGLKIDQSFIADINKDKGNTAIVKSIIALAHNLGLEVVAEGVETKEQANFLLKNKCHKAQGFLYSKPVSEKDILSFFKTKK